MIGNFLVEKVVVSLSNIHYVELSFECYCVRIIVGVYSIFYILHALCRTHRPCRKKKERGGVRLLLHTITFTNP